MDNQQNQSQNAFQQAPLSKSGLAIAGFVLGIVALLGSWIPILNNLAFPLAVVGLVLGVCGFVGIARGKKSGKGLAIAAIVLSIVSGAVVLGSQAMYSSALNQASEQLEETASRMDGSATSELLGNEVNVEFGSFTVDESTGFASTSLSVTVTNNASEAKSYSIQIEALNPDGSRLDDDYVYANDLGPGQSQTFESFMFVSSDQIEAFRSATFNVVSVSQY